MNYVSYVLFSDDTISDTVLPKDDVDRLFEKLQPLEPPPSLIERILKLPLNSSSPPLPSAPVLHDPWQGLDSLVIRNHERKPC